MNLILMQRMNWNTDIWHEFRAGKLERFYRDIYPGLILYAERYLGEEDAFLAEDCVQDAIFNAWKRRHDIDSPPAFKSFLYTAIKNSIVSIHRKNAARDHYRDELSDDRYFDNSVIDQEARTILYDAIRSLPEREREVFEMSFLDGLKNAEIAEKLVLSESSIKKYKASALEILRSKLDPNLFTLLLGVL